MLPYFEYEFSDETMSAISSGGTTGSLAISSGGVNFTWSFSDPQAQAEIGSFPDGTPSVPTFVPTTVIDGTLTAFNGTTATAPSAVFRLDLADPGQSFQGVLGSPIDMDIYSANGVWTVVFHTTGGGMSTSVIGRSTISSTTPGGSITYCPSTSIELILTGTYSHITFTSSFQNAFLAIDDIEAIITCFCAGTLIGTPQGDVPVETLSPGDQVLTASGGVSTVRWLGQQTIDTRTGHPDRINPICISAGALGDNLPTRDLYLSANHAVFLDGYLIDAGALVNGTSIRQVAEVERETLIYYHIETDAHELLMSEGVASESYLEMKSDTVFDNADERQGAPVTQEMPLLRVSTARMLPASVKERIAARAETVVSAGSTPLAS